jgi:hypothetical protein
MPAHEAYLNRNVTVIEVLVLGWLLSAPVKNTLLQNSRAILAKIQRNVWFFALKTG